MQKCFDTLLSDFRISILDVADSWTSNESWFFWIVIVFFEQIFELKLDKINNISFFDQIHFVHENKDVSDTDLSTKKDMFFSLGHRSVNSWHNQNTCVHLSSSSDHVLDVIDVSRAVYVSIMSRFCFILKSCSIDGNTSGFFFRGFIDFGVFNIFSFLPVGKILGNCGGECCLTVINVSDCTN